MGRQRIKYVIPRWVTPPYCGLFCEKTQERKGKRQDGIRKKERRQGKLREFAKTRRESLTAEQFPTKGETRFIRVVCVCLLSEGRGGSCHAARKKTSIWKRHGNCCQHPSRRLEGEPRRKISSVKSLQEIREWGFGFSENGYVFVIVVM